MIEVGIATLTGTIFADLAEQSARAEPAKKLMRRTVITKERRWSGAR